MPELAEEPDNTGNIAAWPIEIRDKPSCDWVTTGIEYDGNGRVDSVNRTGSCHSIADRNNYGNRPAEEVGR